MQPRRIEHVLDEHAGEVMALPGVVGVGIGEAGGEPCIKVFVVERTPALASRIPGRLEGYAVVLEETGEIRAQEP